MIRLERWYRCVFVCSCLSTSNNAIHSTAPPRACRSRPHQWARHALESRLNTAFIRGSRCGSHRCGRRAARVNWRFQCKFESNTRRVQRPLLPGPPRVSSSMTGGRGCTRTLGLRAMGRRAFGAFWVTWGSLGRQSGGLCARATRKTFAGDRPVPLPSLLTRKKSAHSTEDGPPSTSVLGCGRSWTTTCSLSTGLYIYPPPPPSCPSPPYTITHSAGHPSLFTFTPPVHLLPIPSPTQLDTLPAYLPLPSYFPTFLLSYFPTLTVHLLPILSLTQLDTPLPSHSHTTCPVSTSSLYYHSLSWTPSLPTFPYRPTFLLSYSYCPPRLPILSPPQLDTLPSQCELRLLRLQQRQRRVLERGRWLFPRPPNQVPIR